MTDTASPKYLRTIPSKNWRSMGAYAVVVDGIRIGRVERLQDSSRTGGLWTATFRGRYVGTFDTRGAAGDALVRHYATTGFAPKGQGG